MSIVLWVILVWVGISVLGAILAALFMRGGHTGGHHEGPALDPLSTRRRRRPEKQEAG